MKKKLVLFKIMLLMIVSLALVSPVLVSAQNKDAVCEGAGLVSGDSGCEPSDGSTTINDAIESGLNLFSAIIGLIAIVMIMVGGIKYITSQGDATQTNNAKNTILYAAIGLVVAALSQVLVRYVVGRFV